ncbi:MAG: type II toxin-antitoxin system HicB family antitoxin [Acidobacteria bacterium]|nr:type II toxin-antitoxin system HicB family antitoxin [Acidobacteriota bacterium]
MNRHYSYQINLIPEKEGGYTVLVPLRPGCVSWGRNAEEATRHAREAIELHIENLIAHRQPVPGERAAAPVLTAFVEVTPSHV